jgi:superfamily II DNA or RNA helicase
MKITLVNPQYIQMIKLGRNPRWTPREVIMPVMTTRFLQAPNETTISLYPEQQLVYDEIKDYTCGLLEAQTGAGKTVISIALHQAWGGRTLVVCHNLVLAKQFAEEFIKFIDLKPTFFCDGKHDQTGEVVITTLSSFRKEYMNFVGFDNLIIDESDLALTDKMVKAIILFKSTRKWAFTGTIKSAYDDCNKQYAPVLAEFWGAHVVHHSGRETPLKAVYSYEYKKIYEKKFPHKDWMKFREALDEDIDRKKAQLAYVIGNTDPSGYTLCLWDRVADVEAFYRAFKKRGYVVYMSTGEMNKTDRENHIAEFKKTGGYLLGVSSTLNRGYDNTLLTKAFILHPIKGENPLRQTIGRILRHFEGKESFLYLWTDSMLGFQLDTQKKIIKKFFNLTVI